MAKVNNLATQGLKGTLDNMTFVNSKAYGDHVRRKRGTVKPAVLNDAMVQSKDRLLQVNETARLIFNSIRNEHKDGSLWSRLLSVLRRQLKETNDNNVKCLLKLECHAEHTLTTMLRSDWFIEIAPIVKRRLCIDLKIPEAPMKRKKKYLPESQVGIHVIFHDPVHNRLRKEEIHSDVFSKTSYPLQLPFVVPVPARVQSYAIFLKVTECINGEAKSWPQSTGMRCIAVGIIPGKQRPPAKRKTATKKKQPIARKQKARAKGKASRMNRSDGELNN